MLHQWVSYQAGVLVYLLCLSLFQSCSSPDLCRIHQIGHSVDSYQQSILHHIYASGILMKINMTKLEMTKRKIA